MNFFKEWKYQLLYKDYRPIWRLKMWYQRIKWGWCDEDVWGLGHHLAEVIAGSLKQLKRNQRGHPAQFTEKQWNEILDKMIRGFDACAKEDDVYYGEIGNNITRETVKKAMKNQEKRVKQWEKDMQLFVENILSLWD